jgi:hypothetical protein
MKIDTSASDLSHAVKYTPSEKMTPTAEEDSEKEDKELLAIKSSLNE